jgi:hypothetical protein
VSVSKATIVGNVTALQTFATNPAANSTKNFVTLDGFNNEHALTPSTTPDADDVWGGLVTLSGGAATIDLTALTGADSATKNFDGKKIRAIKVRAKSTSAGAFTIAKGASNGYTGFGATFSVTLPANASGGAWFMFYDAGGGTAVSGTVKTLDVSGTGAQVLEVIVVAGD